MNNPAYKQLQIILNRAERSSKPPSRKISIDEKQHINKVISSLNFFENNHIKKIFDESVIQTNKLPGTPLFHFKKEIMKIEEKYKNNNLSQLKKMNKSASAHVAENNAHSRSEKLKRLCANINGGFTQLDKIRGGYYGYVNKEKTKVAKLIFLKTINSYEKPVNLKKDEITNKISQLQSIIKQKTHKSTSLHLKTYIPVRETQTAQIKPLMKKLQNFYDFNGCNDIRNDVNCMFSNAGKNLFSIDQRHKNFMSYLKEDPTLVTAKKIVIPEAKFFLNNTASDIKRINQV